VIPGPIQIIRCPYCEKLQKRRSLISGNTIGATFYSDGKSDAPMCPEFPVFVKCPSCDISFKITRVYREYPFNIKIFALGHAEHDTWLEDLPSVRFMSVGEYINAINNGLFYKSEEDNEGWKSDELNLRMLLWRAYNDRVRDGVEGSESGYESANDHAIYVDNSRKLLQSIADTSDDESCLMRAELYRNIGEFDKCITELGKFANNCNFSLYISCITRSLMDECKARNVFTVRIDTAKVHECSTQSAM